MGATLSMIGSFLYVALNYHPGLTLIAISNFFLIWYAIDAILEYYRILVLSMDADDPD